MSDAAPASGVVDGLFRRSAGRLVSMLAGRLGADRLDLAEEAVQDALLRALELWPHRGVPADPEAWLHTVARNRALDLLRRETRSATLLAAADRELAAPAEPTTAARDEVRLLLLAAHPSLTPRARVVLALKLVAGFGTREIARALFADEAAVAQMLVRAKRTIRSSGIALAPPTPADLEQRLASALDTVYLMFNEGHSASEGELAIREDVCVAAIRLGELLAADPDTARPEVFALLALMSFHASRLAARIGPAGELLTLERQDRSRWDRARIDAGLRYLDQAAVGSRVTHWHLEAGIASLHAVAKRSDEVDWRTILQLYDRLLELRPSPIARLNRAVALARVEGPEAALEEVRVVAGHPALANYYLLAAVEAELQSALGDSAAARDALARARAGARTAPERALLDARIAELGSQAEREPPSRE
ncbi:MAG: sigma-70 family RNA polymerase sigma factor [Gemmatimonadales bacterium]